MRTWSSPFPSAEPITVARTGASLSGLVDPAANLLYLNRGVDVQADDVVGFRGYTRRIVEVPQVWLDAGVVAVLESAPAALLDLGELYRPDSGGGAVDEDTGEIDVAASTPVWSGPCLVEPAGSNSDPVIGDQPVGVVPFVVTVPLALVDARTGDLFKVTQSNDGRLMVRTLVVKAVLASSSATVRQLLAFDNQGA